MSATQGTIRHLLRAALRRACDPLPPVLVLASAAALADTGAWDCRMAPDGRSWECYQSGRLVDDGTASGRPPVSIEAPGEAEEARPPTGPVEQPSPPPATAPARPPETERPPLEPVSTPTVPAREVIEPSPGAAAPPETARKRLPSPTVPERPLPLAAEPVPEPTPPPLPKMEEFAAPPAARVETAPAAPPPAPLPMGPGAHEAFQDAEMPDLLQTPGTAIAPEPAPAQAPAPPSPALTTDRPDVAQAEAAARPLAGGIDAGIDWATCPSPGSRQPTGTTAHDRSAPVEVTADAAVAELDPQQAMFSGDVQLVQGSLHLSADELTLNRTTGEVTARGNLLFDQPDIRIAGSAASYQLSTGLGQVEQASYRVPAIRARGDAERGEFLGEGRSRFEGISYTTCAPGDADWLLSAETLELDRDEGLGTARHASLRFLGVPVLYAPVFTFPIDDRRRSGVLVPAIGQSGNTGFDLTVPYYLNLAPNYDLTLTPRLMSKRGLMLGGEFRFLTESTRGTLAAEFLPSDNDYEGKDDDRGAASLRMQSTLSPQALANLRLNYVSDDDYLSDFGGSLAATSATHLERTGELFYAARTWDALARVQYYQTVDATILPADRPFSRRPQLAFSLQDPDGISGLTYHLDAEYVNFHRRDSVRGHRIDLFPALSLPLRETWGFVEPKLGARYTAYDLTDQIAGLDDSPSTLSGLFSLDGGLYFDRGASYFGRASTQTLEPRLHYLFVPHSGQDDQPVFDTGLYDFNFDNLFRENRFSGPDRHGDANQATLALTSRFLSNETGAELLRMSLGQILYFEDREVTLPGAPEEDDSSSAVVAELAAGLGSGWHTRLGLQWDPHDGSDGTIDQALAQINYRDVDRHVFSAAYRLRNDVTEQTDLAVFWPLNERFTLVGRHNYSLQDSRLLEALAGIEYGRCCWRIRALVRKYTDSSGDDHNLAFLLQLELNGLGRFGDDIESALERSIYGYEDR